MSFTEITPYDGQLPSSSDPASFDGRASALMSWLVANFAPEIQALAVEIATALNGEEDTLAAVQALADSLKSAAHYNANDDEDFAVDPNALPTRSAVAGYVGDEIGSQTLGHGSVSSNAANYSSGTWYQNATGRPIFLMIRVGSSSPEIQLSSDGVTPLYNGSDLKDFGWQSIIVPVGYYWRFTGGSVALVVEVT